MKGLIRTYRTGIRTYPVEKRTYRTEIRTYPDTKRTYLKYLMLDRRIHSEYDLEKHPFLVIGQ